MRHSAPARQAIVPRQLSDLLTMLEYKRPMGSRAERKFRRRYLFPLGAKDDGCRNLHRVIPNEDGSASRVLWSSHTDTVHNESGRQRIAWDSSLVAKLAAGEASNCLGGDDTVGVWLMREMILAGRPGHYVFHWGEERGGIGSRDAADLRPGMYTDIDLAIALDRAGTSDVITHQMSQRTCSDICAKSIASELARHGLDGFAPARGLYTDTAEYSDIIGECTNLSIGYRAAHSPAESVDLMHCARMLVALLAFDAGRIEVSRLPGQTDPADYRPLWADRDWSSWDKSYQPAVIRPTLWREKELVESDLEYLEDVDGDSGSWKYRHEDDGYDYSRYEQPLSAEDKSVLREMGLVYRSQRRR